MALPGRRERVVNLDIYGKEEKKEFLPDIKIENYHEHELTSEESLNSYLFEKSKELQTIQAKASLELGKIFTEVEERLGGNNQYDGGIYVKWLEINGYNKMTALRHKRRYRLFSRLNSDVGKVFIATVPQSIINDILIQEVDIQENILAKIEEGTTKEQIKAMLSSSDLLLTENTVEISNIKCKYENVTSIINNISLEKLNVEEKINFEKDIKKIEKILLKYKR